MCYVYARGNRRACAIDGKQFQTGKLGPDDAHAVKPSQTRRTTREHVLPSAKAMLPCQTINDNRGVLPCTSLNSYVMPIELQGSCIYYNCPRDGCVLS